MAYEKIENLLWLDMEMSGLDVNKEVIIEVACIVTDMNFRELDCFETVVKQPQVYLDNMDAWNTEHQTSPLAWAIGWSMYRVGLAMVAVCVLGIPLGILMGTSPKIDAFLSPA